MESKLGLNFDLVEKARTSAANVAADVQGFIDQHTTVTKRDCNADCSIW